MPPSRIEVSQLRATGSPLNCKREVERKSVVLQTVPVDTKGLVTAAQFESYMRPPGRPLVVHGWTQNWRALSTWEFEFFKTNYGEDRISLMHPLKDSEGPLSVTMRDYVDYILDPTGPSALNELERASQLTQPFYSLYYKPFRNHPELLEDFSFPPFAANWWPFFNDSFKKTHFPQGQGWIFLGRKNSVAAMHQDSHHTFTWLAQIRGRKTCYLFAPHDSEAVYQGNVDPANPDWDKFPRFRDATTYVCTLNPGEMLFLPPDWWHHVIAIDDVITISYNFVNHINLGDYLRKAFGERIPDLLAVLPGVLPARD